MHSESHHSSGRPLLALLTMLAVWALGGTYVWHHPQPVVAHAVIQVPPATDPATLCQNPEIVQAAAAKLAELNPEPSLISGPDTHEPNVAKKLAGSVSGKKATDGSWKLSYQAPSPDLAVNELTALLSVLDGHLSQPQDERTVLDRQQLVAKLKRLTTRKLEIQRQIRNQRQSDGASEIRLAGYQREVEGVNSTDSEVEVMDSTEDDEPTGAIESNQEQIVTLQRALTETRIERLKMEEEFGLVESSLASGRKLEAIANQLSPGPLQDAVRQIDRQVKLSLELKQIHTSLSHDSEIYGDKHPRLQEQRRRFDRVLQEVGGWDHVLAEGMVEEHLLNSLNQTLMLRRQRETDLKLQLDLEQSGARERVEQSRARTKSQESLKKIQAEIVSIETAVATIDKTKSIAFTIVQQPAVNGSLTLIERGWPWGLVVCMGLVCGFGVNRIPHREPHFDFQIPVQTPLLTVPRVLLTTQAGIDPRVAVSVPPETEQLDLAQRRAARQARWQQSYPH